MTASVPIRASFKSPLTSRAGLYMTMPSAGQAQRFLAVYGPMAQHFRPRCHLLPAPIYRQEMRQRFRTW
jgi:hypothetical protein